MSKSQAPVVPERLAEIHRGYLKQLEDVFGSFAKAQALVSTDRRFAAPAWHDNPVFTNMAALYLVNSQALKQMADAVAGDEKLKQRTQFLVEQFVNAASPANFLATNPEAQAKLIETKGESLRVGMDNLMADLERGRIRQTDETQFVVGENLATTEGAVVFRNEIFELLHYRPRTQKVGSRPLLMVPPNINKFYIMDLQPGSSLVEFALDQGNDVYLISWRNVTNGQGSLTWDDYIEHGVITAIHGVKDISGSETVNMLGFCVGGTLTTTAAAVLAARDDHSIHAITLMTTLIDFVETGLLDLFIDEQQVAMREATIGKGGLLSGKELATTFSFLRPNDLVWNYVVKNYLKGEQPPPFDILYWNSDSTNLPGPFYCWYLRNTYLENNLIKPNRLRVAGELIDLSKIKAAVYAFGAKEDHIVPWESAWASAKHLGRKVRFVLGASGHVAGAINPASKNKRSYWTANGLGRSPEDFLSSATEHAGSWWNDWAAWIEQHKGPAKAAPKQLGKNQRYKVLEPAPGSYVHDRF